jgi:hypothetical protein
MSYFPDSFNINMALDPQLPFIKGIGGLTVTRGAINSKAIDLVKALLYLGIKRGDTIAVVMSPSIDSIIAEVACFLGGYPLISIKSPKSLKSVQDGTQKKVEKIYKTTNHRIKYIITKESYETLLASDKVNIIEDYPEPEDLMYFGQTAGTTAVKNAIGKISLCSREKVEKQIICNRNDNGVIDDHNCLWYAFGNPYSMYHSRTLQSIIINRGSIVFHNPEIQTIDSIINIINELQPTRFSYLKPVPSNAYDRDRISKISPLLAIDLMNRPTEDLLTIFKNVSLDSKVVRSFKMIGASNIKNSIELIEQIENIHSSLKFYNSFGSSETVMKLASDYDDTLENRLYKHGKNKWGDDIIRLEDNGQMLIHTDYTCPYTENYDSFIKDDVWFKTANSFKYDDNGYFEFLGRIRDD